ALGAGAAGLALFSAPAWADYGVNSGGSQTATPGASNPNPLGISGGTGGQTTGSGVTTTPGGPVTVAQTSGGCPPGQAVTIFVVYVSSTPGSSPSPVQVGSATADGQGGFGVTFNAPSTAGPYTVYSSCGPGGTTISTAALTVQSASGGRALVGSSALASATDSSAANSSGSDAGSSPAGSGLPASFAVSSSWGTPELRAAVDSAVTQQIATQQATTAAAQPKAAAAAGSGSGGSVAALGSTGLLSSAHASSQASDVAEAAAAGLVVTAGLMTLRRRRNRRSRRH
ncbi:MAG TPA: hypothetical protein VFH70_03750, partial [Acidimicrobiales bacterium]|nr:hypothetical protein [Acidimicrobiales bacterium]